MKKLLILWVFAFTMLSCNSEKENNTIFFTFQPSDPEWTYTAPSWVADIPYTLSTSQIETGIISVYMKYPTNNDNFVKLPFTYYPSSTYSTTVHFDYGVNGFRIFVTNSDLTQPTFPGSIIFKIFIIPNELKQMNPEIDFDQYEEVVSLMESTNN